MADDPTDDLEQIANNLELAAGTETADNDRALRRAASDIRVVLDDMATDGMVVVFDDDELEALRDGETVETILEEDGDRTDKLETVWKTEIEAGPGAREFVEEMNSVLNDDSTGDTDDSQ